MKKFIIASTIFVLTALIYLIFINNEDLNVLIPRESDNAISIESDNKLVIHFINMGRNDGIVIQTNDIVIAIDGGAYHEADLIINYMKALGITHIDILIGSHVHFNHIQSHARILQSFTVGKLYYPHELELCFERNICNPNDVRYVLDEINYQNKEINIMKARDIIEVGPITIESFGPLTKGTFRDHRWPQNYNSLNFILTFGNHRFFFTGDGMQEANILSTFYDSNLKVDVFKFPHHGEDVLSAEFINKISPRYVVETNHTSQLVGVNRRTGNLLLDIGASILYFEDNRHIIFFTDGINLFYKRKTINQFLEMGDSDEA